MAKQQTFGDKLKKKAVDSRTNVKVIKSYFTEEGNMRFLERLVKVQDLSELEKIDISK